MSKKIAIQGFEGSFHHIVANQFFGKDAQLICCATFKEVIKNTLSNKDCYAGAMAIENSIAGSIIPNYTLLQKSGLVISGEVYLPIKQHLLANKGVQLADIKEVQSHPMAILQCHEYLDKQSWKLIETEDTALSAKYIHQHKHKHTAAIASKLAAELYNLEVIAPNIHTQKNNYTRFLIIEKKVDKKIITGANKASVNFRTDHSQGSLAKVLNQIADYNINLSKLQSMPIPGTAFQYSFYADMEFNNLEQLHRVLEQLKKSTKEFTIFGIYKNGKEII